MSGVVRVYAVVLAIVLMSGVASATTHTVCALGCDYTTIQAAVTAAASYDTVYVYNGTYTENVNIGTAHLTLEGEGRDVVTISGQIKTAADYVNVSEVAVVAVVADWAAIRVENSNCNISNNRVIEGVYGILIFHSANNNNISDNIIESCYYGIFVDPGILAGMIPTYTPQNNMICNNSVINNTIGIYSHVGNAIADNTRFINNNVSDTFNAVYDNSQSSEYSNNIFDTKNSVMLVPSLIRSIIPTELTEFNVSVKNVNGTSCSDIVVNSISSIPEEDIAYSTNGNIININFTPTQQGLYSLFLNVTQNDNIVMQRFYFGNTSMKRYYFRDDCPTHALPCSELSIDYGSLLNSTPSEEEDRHCGGFLMFSVDELPNLEGISRIIDANASFHHKGGGFSQHFFGIERSITTGTRFGYGTPIPKTSSYIWTNKNLRAGLWIYDVLDWYQIGLKIGFYQPSVITYPAGCVDAPNCSSFIDFSYLYSTTPIIKSISNIDILLLSATSPAADDTSASIVLDGEGATNLTVQMPNTMLTYAATYDGSPCNDAACSFTQSNGELNFSLILGSEHTIEITEEGGDNSTYATHLTATTPGTVANSITTTTTCADASFGAATLTGGSDSDSAWAGSDVPTGVDIWRDGAGMIVIVVLALLAGIVIVCLRGGGIGEGLTISPNAAIGLAVGLLVLVAIFGIAPIFGDKIDSVADLGQETYATGRLSFVQDGTTADGETVTIDATTLEFDRSANGVTAGRIPVNISDSTAATASLNLTAAINGNATLAAVVVARRDVST